MDIGSILGSIFSGGITGVIGSIASAISNYKLKKLEYQHEEEMSRIRMQMLEKQTESNVKISQEIIKQIEAQADLESMRKSYEVDQATYSKHIDLSKYGILGKILGAIFGFLLYIVDFFRGIIRPGSTIVFELYMFFVWYTMYKMVQGFESLPVDKLVELFTTVTLLLLYVGTTCVVWWFGNRHVDKWFEKYTGRK